MPKDKLKTIYVCTQCGETSPRWLGRCPSCGAWNTMTEDVVAEPAKASGGKAAATPRVTGQTSLVAQKLKNISTTEEKAASSPASASWIAFWVVASSSAV